MKDQTVSRILAFFLLISAVLVYVAYESVRNIDRSMASNDWVNHTHEVILEVNGVLSAVRAGDSAAHTYAMTGDPGSRAACREAFGILGGRLDAGELGEHLQVAEADTRNEPAQHEEIVRLISMAGKRADFARALIAARQSGNGESVRALLASDDGVEANREIQGMVKKLTAEEMALLADRDHASYVQADNTRKTVWSGVVIDFLLLGGVAWLIRDDIGSRRRAASILRDANEQLEARVRARTSELAATNERLRAENLERRWGNQALEHQLRYNHLIVNSISDLVFVLTKAMNISRINPAVVHLTGLEQEELINRPFSCVVQLLDDGPGADTVLLDPGPPLAAVVPMVGGILGTDGPLIDPLTHALAEGRDLRDLPAIVEDRRGRKTAASLTLYPLRDREKVVGGVAILQVAQEKA
jgi:CHASE3 domain sensor protein